MSGLIRALHDYTFDVQRKNETSSSGWLSLDPRLGKRSGIERACRRNRFIGLGSSDRLRRLSEIDQYPFYQTSIDANIPSSFTGPIGTQGFQRTRKLDVGIRAMMQLPPGSELKI
jgi:hypothetical protein